MLYGVHQFTRFQKMSRKKGRREGMKTAHHLKIDELFFLNDQKIMILPR